MVDGNGGWLRRPTSLGGAKLPPVHNIRVARARNELLWCGIPVRRRARRRRRRGRMSSYDEALLVASGMALDLPSDSDESDSSVDDGTEFLYPAHMTEAATYAVATITAEKQGLPGGERVF